MAEVEGGKKVDEAVPVIVEEKTMVVPHPEEKPLPRHQDSKALAIAENASESVLKKISGGSIGRDIALAEVEKEKKLSFVKAWEEAEKTKAENKAQKKQHAIDAWENSRKAALEADLKKIEEKLEKTKAEYAEKMKNKVAMVHKQADEKRAMVEAMRGKEILMVEETAAKHRATGQKPKSSTCGCF